MYRDHSCFHQRFTWLKDLGKGRYGSVVHALDRANADRPVAVKMVNTKSMFYASASEKNSKTEERARRYLVEEIESLRRLSDKAGILELYDYFDGHHALSDDAFAYIVTNSCDGGTLENALKSAPNMKPQDLDKDSLVSSFESSTERIELSERPKSVGGKYADQEVSPSPWRPFSDAEIAFLMLQIMDALLAMEEVGIVHRDVKPDNIFIHTRDAATYDITGNHKEATNPFSWTLFLGDFGLAKVVKPMTESQLSIYRPFLRSQNDDDKEEDNHYQNQSSSPSNQSQTRAIAIPNSSSSRRNHNNNEEDTVETHSWKAITLLGTPQYMCPEIFSAARKDTPYTYLVDAWAAGIILFRLLLLQLPYENMQSLAELQRHMLSAKPGPMLGWMDLQQEDYGPPEQTTGKISMSNISQHWRPLLTGLLAKEDSRWTAQFATRYIVDICFACKWQQCIDTFLAMRLANPNKSSQVLQLFLNRASNPHTLMSDSFQFQEHGNQFNIIHPLTSSSPMTLSGARIMDRSSHQGGQYYHSGSMQANGRFLGNSSTSPELPRYEQSPHYYHQHHGNNTNANANKKNNRSGSSGAMCNVYPSVSNIHLEGASSPKKQHEQQLSGKKRQSMNLSLLLDSPCSTRDVRVKTITVPFCLDQFLDAHWNLSPTSRQRMKNDK